MKRSLLMILLVGIFGLWAPLCAAQENAKQAETEATEEEEAPQTRAKLSRPNVKFFLKAGRDPMLSPDDVLLLRRREELRRAAAEAERKRKEEAERKRLAEEERRRQWELMLIKDPTVLVRNQIRISGLIDKEVLIGGKLYTIGNTYKGAKIVAVGADSVTFSYKGHKFVKKVSL